MSKPFGSVPQIPALSDAPTANPPSGALLLYFKSDGKLYQKDSTGTEALVGGSGGGAQVQPGEPTGTPEGHFWYDSDDPGSGGGGEPPIAPGTMADYWRGDKTWQILDKIAVGLPNVDNTSDADKPISTVVQTALDAKAASAQEVTVQVLGTGWHRIAVGTTRCFGKFTLHDALGNTHNRVEITAGIAYGASSYLRVTPRITYSTFAYTQVRLVKRSILGTNDAVYLEVYFDGIAAGNVVNIQFEPAPFGAPASQWTLLEPLVWGSVPAGYNTFDSPISIDKEYINGKYVRVMGSDVQVGDGLDAQGHPGGNSADHILGSVTALTHYDLYAAASVDFRSVFTVNGYAGGDLVFSPRTGDGIKFDRMRILGGTGADGLVDGAAGTGVKINFPGIGWRQIVMGTPDSAGAGFRTLKIAN